MKTRKLFMRAMAVALAVIMVVAAAVPAFAAEDGGLKITIKAHPNPLSPSLVNRTFYAFQILRGDTYKDETVSVNSSEHWGAENWDNYTLSNIEWGDEIVISNGVPNFLKKLVNLQSDAQVTNSESSFNGKTMAEAWPELFPEGTNICNKEDISESTTAEEFANFLVNKQNAFLQEFCAFLVLGPNRKVDFNHNLVADTSFLNVIGVPSGKGPTDELTEKNEQKIEITVNSPGYYLIVEGDETTGHEEDDGVFQGTYQMYSEYILAVLGNQTIYEKAQLPSLEKEIVHGSEGSVHGDIVGVGDELEFTLTGTLPTANWGDFQEYFYYFVDDFSNAGLTFGSVTSVKIQLADKSAEYTLARATSEDTLAIDGSYIIQEDPLTSLELVVQMQDLKQKLIIDSNSEQKPGDDEEHYTLVGDESIIVTYKATVNGNKPDSTSGGLRQNSASVWYSNDPDTDSFGNTPESKVYLYSFGLDLEKVGSDHTEIGLPGAGFILLNETNSKVASVEFKAGDAIYDRPYYLLKEWVDYSVVEPLITAYDEAYKELQKTGSDVQDDYDKAVNALSSYILMSSAGEDGQDQQGKFQIQGLDDGTYYLREIIVPGGYNSLDRDIQVKIEASIDKNTGTLKDVTYEFDGYFVADGESVSGTTLYFTRDQSGNTAQEQKDFWMNPTIQQNILNEKAPFLPFTGGVGTIVFYAAGGVLIVGALIYLVIASKKRKNRTDA